MEVTVVMSVYNGEKTIIKAIESILEQTFKNFEFIIVDDGSTDKTFEILEYYKNKDNRIFIVKQIRRGLAYSLNYALDLSKGIYIVRQDADDVSLSDRIEKQINFIKRSNLDIVSSYAYLVNEKGVIIKLERRPLSHNDIVSGLKRHNCILHPTVVFRKEAIISIGGYNPEYKLTQDYELYLKAIQKGLRFGCFPEPLVKITHSSEAISVKDRRRQLFYAISAQSKYFASQEKIRLIYVFYIMNHIVKILIPIWMRNLRAWLRNRL